MAVTGSTIIFGATGMVGSAVAQALHKSKAGKIFLASRDTSKPIPLLDALPKSSTSSFVRVQADLTQPVTLKEVVRKTGATKALLYVVFGQEDGLRASIEALHDAGIRFAVLLGAAALIGNRHAVVQSDILAWIHGVVEQNLEAVFGKDHFVALRPGYFDTNALFFRKSIQAGHLTLPYPDAKLDWIASEDIGALAAVFLKSGTQPDVDGEGTERDVLRVVGPQMRSLRDGITAICRAAGKDPNITGAETEAEAVEALVAIGMPVMAAKGSVQELKDAHDNGGMCTASEHSAFRQRVEKYLGRPGMTVEQWAERHKAEILA